MGKWLAALLEDDRFSKNWGIPQTLKSPALPWNGPKEMVQNPHSAAKAPHRHKPPSSLSLGSLDLTNLSVLHAKAEEHFDLMDIHKDIITDTLQYSTWHPQDMYWLNELRIMAGYTLHFIVKKQKWINELEIREGT